MAQTLASTISDEQLAELLGLIKGADSVELKLTVPDVGSAAGDRGRSASIPLDAQIRQVFFFDTPDLALERHGRRGARPPGPGEGRRLGREAAPGRPGRASDGAARSPSFGVEVDAMPGGFVCSASMKGAPARADVRETPLDGRQPLRKLFSKEQRAFFAEHAPDGIALDDLSVLGPIFVLKLKFTPEELRPPARRRDVALPGRLADPRAVDEVRARRRPSRSRPRRVRSSRARAWICPASRRRRRERRSSSLPRADGRAHRAHVTATRPALGTGLPQPCAEHPSSRRPSGARSSRAS